MSILGNRVQQLEDVRFLLGQGRYVANVAPPDAAAVVPDQQHRPVAVISVWGPVERFRHEVAISAGTLTEATREFSTRLGARSDAS